MSVSAAAVRLAVVRERIARAAEGVGRDPSTVGLIAVSKLQTVVAIRALFELGLRDFGENYGQELVDKAARLADLEGLRWHHIGHVQSNKVRALVPTVSLFHGVDRQKLIVELERRAAERDVVVEVLVQVNVSGETTKTGCTPADLGMLLADAERLPHLRVRGLMTMPPAAEDGGAARPYFHDLRVLRDEHGGTARLPELSMGMSHDFEVAIEEGATMVRVGTALFGARVN